MLSSAIAAAGISGSLDAVLSAESAGIFKPHRQVYDLVVERFLVQSGGRNIRIVERMGRLGSGGLRLHRRMGQQSRGAS